MCSIIGVLSRKNQDSFDLATRLLSALKHRGSESFGLKSPTAVSNAKTVNGLSHIPSKIFLGHSLLSTTGYCEQPITKGDVSVAHNGQLYNYNELVSGSFASDSEAIAQYFSRELKKKTVQLAVSGFMKKAVGEYAVAFLYRKKLYAFRDFLGFKPIWFGSNENVFAFASEPNALRKIDIEFPVPLEPGQLLELSKKGFSVKKIFSVKDFRKIVPKKSSFKNFQGVFERTIDLQTNGLSKAAVLFSGGVDSSLVAKAVSLRVKDTRLFVAGLENSHDLVNAESAARELKLSLEKIVLTEKSIQGIAFECANSISFFDEMQIGIGVPLLACAKRIKELNYKVVFSGQGSDEIFCGYSNYASILKEKGFSAVNEEIWFSIARMWSRNFHRDDAVISSQSLELRVPLMSQLFLREAMAIPIKEKILSEKDELRKHPIRKLASAHGISDLIVNRKKKALQYGSGSQKIVSKLVASKSGLFLAP